MEVKSVAFTLTKQTHTRCVNIESKRHVIADSNTREDYWRERERNVALSKHPGPDNACNPLQSDFTGAADVQRAEHICSFSRC